MFEFWQGCAVECHEHNQEAAKAQAISLATSSVCCVAGDAACAAGLQHVVSPVTHIGFKELFFSGFVVCPSLTCAALLCCGMLHCLEGCDLPVEIHCAKPPCGYS